MDANGYIGGDPMFALDEFHISSISLRKVLQPIIEVLILCSQYY